VRGSIARPPGLVLAEGVVHRHSGCRERSWAVIGLCALDMFHTAEDRQEYVCLHAHTDLKKKTMLASPVAEQHFRLGARRVTCLQCLVNGVSS
jgi:hypothetical protein